MVSTEKLFYKDSHMVEFDALVLDCQPNGDNYEVVLDRTTFFPEGGGQYADMGTLGQAKVLDAQDKKMDGFEVVVHITDQPLKVGESVHGVINWEQRFDRMQQHSGEHIVSGLVHKRFGYDNVGFHLADDYCTMDFSGPITKEELRQIEEEANRAIFKNLQIHQIFPAKEELSDYEYRSKIEIESQVRLIEIPGYDLCACCAPHVEQTGEIGLLKLVNMINYKGGERVFMLCGSRALKDYQEKEKSVKNISALFCVKETEVYEGGCRLKKEEAELKAKIVSLKTKLLSLKAETMDVSDDIVVYFGAEMEKNAPREFMNLLLDKGAKICAVFSGTDTTGYRYVIGSKTQDVRPLAKKLNEAFEGRGGGKPEMVQGSVKGSQSDILSFLH